MAVTTWTFTSNFQAWTFSDQSIGGGTASRVHVSGAIETTLAIPTNPPNDRQGIGDHISPILNATIANGDTIAFDFGPVTGTQTTTSFVITATYTDTTTEQVTYNSVSGSGTRSLTLTQSKTLDFFTIRYSISAGGVPTPARNAIRDLLEVRLTTATAFVGTGERPLELDVELSTGSKIWVTKWKTGGLYLEEFSDDLTLQNSFPIATGTISSIIDVNNRIYYMTPYAPPFFGTADLDDIVYLHGRWDDGGVMHLEKSIDGGASFTDIGDTPAWGADWVGGFFADDANTLYAFVNGGSPALYRSIDAGANWTNLSTLPFDVDPGGVSKHPDGRILISNRDAGAQTAAYAVSPDYSSWIDATGSPSFPTETPGSGSNSIIWIT